MSTARPIALVTGASQGIGRVLALRLARLGYHVILVARRPDALAESLRLCQAAGGAGEILPADLTSAAATEALLAEVARRHHRLDTLVNNAGAYHHAPLAETPAARQATLLSLNVSATLFLTAGAVDLLVDTARRHGGARLVTIASVAGLRGFADEAVYAATKHAQVGLGRALFLELRERGVGVTQICPGLVATEMAAGRGADMARALTAEDVADALAYVVGCRPGACPTEIVLEPQRDPFG